ncbi:nucleotidyltransferase family protein [Chlorogloea sp. CCALA 695]|uniref:nucleotidyltransferase family protein n=1 Tax=Chlorogloea sp. CCALA 695 TaxID=2107693 RepID=UPI000D07CA61|nr:nucleotidyltransferase family protein [Chlorogloea sp. CCALA 695]PSB26563.1 4-diphosphocytidyl-2C-methyl-D-erythritol synthase [Chlorogloea sp. CCALA 695]
MNGIEEYDQNIGIVILAAGASTRMGTPKQLLSYQERTLLRHTIEVAIASVCRPIVVVLGAYAQLIKSDISQLSIHIVENLQWNEGISSSIGVGIQELKTSYPDVEAVIVTLCDQPFISTEIINQLALAYHSANQPIIACEYAETLGVPALFSERLFCELTTLKDKEGAKQVIKRYAQEVFRISFPEGATDIDTPENYAELLKGDKVKIALRTKLL